MIYHRHRLLLCGDHDYSCIWEVCFRENPCVIFLHQQCRRSNNFQRVLPDGNRTFLEEIGKYCLLLSVFSSLFCNHVECSSYINIYISNGYNLYIIYHASQKYSRKHDVQKNRWWFVGLMCYHKWFSHTQKKLRNKIGAPILTWSEREVGGWPEWCREPVWLCPEQITCHRTRVRSLPCNSLTALVWKYGLKTWLRCCCCWCWWLSTILISQSRIIQVSKITSEMELAWPSYKLLLHNLHC